MIKILTEISFIDGSPQILVCGRDQPDIDSDLFICTDRLHFTFLQSTKKLYLHFVGQVTDLIQKDRSSVSSHKSTGLIIYCPGKRTFHMAEKLGCRQIFGDRPTVDCNKRSLTAITLLMDTTGYIFLPRPTRPGDQYRHIRRGNQADVVEQLTGGRTLSFNISIPFRRFLCRSMFYRRRFHHLTDLTQQLFRIQGFGNIIGCSQLDGLHGGLYLRIASHHDQRQRGIFFLHPLQQVDPVTVR